jgi:hypothetical protein
MTPPPTPKPSHPDQLVHRVLHRLQTHHPYLRQPSLSDRTKFQEKAAALPDLPEWMWYGLLHYAVTLDAAKEQEVVDFGILDEFLDCEAATDGTGIGGLNEPKRMWDIMFYYMYLHLESGRRDGAGGTGVVTPPATEDGESSTEDKSMEKRKMEQNSKEGGKKGKAQAGGKSRPKREMRLRKERQTRRFDARDLVIFFLLLMIVLLLALQFMPPQTLDMFR